MLEAVQILKDSQGEARFAVLDFQEYLSVKNLLSSTEQLEDYLDYLHIQQVKRRTVKKWSLAEVKQELGFE
ncbi:MAG: hypothetical protein BWK78_08775 [Thiotrichaceae bacterium IS1]|nr:MAG: hypothetical protein BWK78_08775 [Thiotrichaceae bacterium IS1]